MNLIANWDEVPLFDNEEAEAAFWAENRLDLRLMEATVVARTGNFGVGDDYAAHRPADVVAHQEDGAIAVSQLPKHDETVD